MQTRRQFAISAGTAGVLVAFAPAARADAVKAPTATLIKGTPCFLDYGGGLKVPCSKDGFFTLWEGETFWLTLGFGVSPSDQTANKLATKQAGSLMKFMLLTLAFAPDRLVRNEAGGWCKKDPSAHDFVLGDLELPVQSSNSVTDAFLGGGNTQISPFWNFGGNISGTNPMAAPGASVVAPPSAPGDLRQKPLYAFSTCFVMKSDLSLDAVRQRAVILQL